MKAALISEPGVVSIADVADPEPGTGEVLIEVAACGICGTDLHILAGQHGSLPLVPGHEFAGRVVATGTGTASDLIDALVGVDPNLPCGACYECRRGRGNLCENHGAIGVTVSGAAAQYVTAPAANCVRLPEGVDVESAALIEPLSCAVRGFDVLGSRLADHVLIYGAGTMGLMNLQLAKRAGAATVSIVDPNTERLRAARALGCTTATAEASELERPRGWDVVIDCTGVVAAIEDGLERLARGGTFLQFGVTAPDAHVRIAPYRIYRDELTIVGSMAVLNSYERAAELFLDGVVDPRTFVSDRFPLESYPESIERARRGEGLKILVVPGGHNA
jgi:2-desacetyl-2-hydroxyethyl bacteriochlorophyllide A dehydrogenase